MSAAPTVRDLVPTRSSHGAPSELAKLVLASVGLGLLLALAPAPCRAGAPSGEPATIKADLEACAIPGVEGPALCGGLRVPENPANPDGRGITLNVVVLPATGERVASDAVTFLAGGGVSPATRLAPFLSRALPTARKHRDVVLLDQRGTGGSHPLHCPDAPSGPACLDALRGEADPRFYTTPRAVEDLDAVRRWLGYETWTIWGASYGTKMARAYLRSHPDRVRALVLHGVVPLERSMWPEMFVSGQEVLDRILGECSMDAACAEANGDAQRNLARLWERLAEGPVEVELPPGPRGEPAQKVILDPASLRRALYGALRTVRLSRRLPEMLREAAAGRLQPLAEGLRSAEGLPLVPRGVYLAIACSEEIARLRGVPPEGATTLDDGTWLREEADACAGWPAGEMPDGFWHEVENHDVPALVLSGALDAITPPRYGARVAVGLTRGRHLVLPDRSHDDVDPCLGGIIDRFLDTADPWDLSIGCLDDPPAGGPPPAQ